MDYSVSVDRFEWDGRAFGPGKEFRPGGQLHRLDRAAVISEARGADSSEGVVGAGAFGPLGWSPSSEGPIRDDGSSRFEVPGSTLTPGRCCEAWATLSSMGCSGREGQGPAIRASGPEFQGGAVD
jgi:hypothetical protein